MTYKNIENAKGFAGLLSLVSDVDKAIEDFEKKVSAKSIKPTVPKKQNKQAPGIPAFTYVEEGSSISGWFIFIIVIIYIIVSSNVDNSSPPTSQYSPETFNDKTKSSRPIETKPPFGKNNVFDVSQIRYCLAQKIRIDALETLINTYQKVVTVERFNDFVSDYNSRCSEFRYREGVLSRAKSDIEPFRFKIQLEVKALFMQESHTQEKVASNSTIKAIQLTLNKLGYKAGLNDGYMGAKTRAAIEGFQRDNHLVETGKVDSNLLAVLKKHNAFLNTPKKESKPKSTLSNSKPITNKSVMMLQKRLNELGYNVGIADGVMGNKTYKAINIFKMDHGHQKDAAALKVLSLIEDATKGRSTAYNRPKKTTIPSVSKSRNGKPDLSTASQSERNAIEKTCNYDKKYNGPATYYSCLRREMSSLNKFSGKPSLSTASQSERNAIEKTCNYDKKYNGPATYYSCLRREMSSL